MDSGIVYYRTYQNEEGDQENLGIYTTFRSIAERIILLDCIYLSSTQDDGNEQELWLHW